MRILVTGRSGQVAMSLRERCARVPGVEVIALGRPDLDLEDAASTSAAIAACFSSVVAA